MSDTPDVEVEKHWHLNRGVPLALIATIALQSLAAVWWASAITENVATVTAEVESLAEVVEGRSNEVDAEQLRQWGRINTNESALERIASDSRVLRAILTRLETQVSENNDILKEYLRGTGAN